MKPESLLMQGRSHQYSWSGFNQTTFWGTITDSCTHYY